VSRSGRAANLFRQLGLTEFDSDLKVQSSPLILDALRW